MYDSVGLWCVTNRNKMRLETNDAFSKSKITT